MVKGHMEKGKFHPHTQSNGVRKSRDQKVKQEGIRMKRGTKIKNLTTERLRKFKGDTIFYDLDGKEYDVDTLWNILEGEGFDNDTQRNSWLKAKFGNVIENEPVPFGKTRKARYAFDDDEETQEITPDYSVGDIVMVSPDNDNQGYDDFRNKKLRITMVATNRDEHRGFDEGVGQALYELETLDGEEIGSSLYDYELESA